MIMFQRKGTMFPQRITKIMRIISNSIVTRNLRWNVCFYSQSAKFRLIKRKSLDSIGILAEDRENHWERRAPLAPSHVSELIQQGIDVYVQQSASRCFKDVEYREVGAKIVESLANVDTIFSIQMPKPHKLLPDKTYVNFTNLLNPWAKGNDYAHVRALQNSLENNIRLIDYAGVKNKTGQRLVKFGHYAGIAAAIDVLHVTGERLLVEDCISTPFTNIGYSKNYAPEKAEEDFKFVSSMISAYGLPKELFPFTIVVAGDGNVSKGAQKMFELLPHKVVDPKKLKELWRKKKFIKQSSPENRFVYICVVKPEDMLEPLDKGKKFDFDHYLKNPKEYENIFAETILPYSRVFMNAMKWSPEYPTLVSNEQLHTLLKENRLRLTSVADVSCDVNGGLEFLSKTTSLTNVQYLYNPRKGRSYENTLSGEGFMVLSVPNWPSAIPKSSSIEFGNHLMKYIRPILDTKGLPLEEQLKSMPEELYPAVITTNNGLSPIHEYLLRFIKKIDSELKGEDPKRVLLLGNGLMTGPIVEYLMRNQWIRMTIAAPEEEESLRLCRDFGRGRARSILLDVQNQEKLEAVIAKHDLVLSLVPAPLHPIIAKLCVKQKKSMITASYLSEDMLKLDRAAKEKEILLLNELGVDPGIDHMMVMEIKEEADLKKGEIVSFQSYCGALPAPESSNNPFGYKFSWSPQGVISALKNNAIYKEANEIVEVDGNLLMYNDTPLVKKATFAPGFAFEMLPNRDSLKYIDFYGFQKDKIQTMIRGTLRFPGFCNMFRALAVFGLLDAETNIEMIDSTEEISWRTIIVNLAGADESIDDQQLIEILVNRISSQLLERFNNLRITTSEEACRDQARIAVTGMIEMGMLNRDEMISKQENLTVMKATCDILTKKLSYKIGERDMIFMHHEFIVNYPEQGNRERISSTLCVYGDSDLTDGFSATARTVGLPVAMGALLYLRGDLADLYGVYGPTDPKIYQQVLKLLRDENIVPEEVRTNLFLDEWFMK